MASGSDTPMHAAAVQVARDSIAQLLAQLPALFTSSPMGPVHVLTLALLRQCGDSLAPGLVQEQTQPTVLIPTHMFAASIAHQEHAGVHLSEAVGYCTARMACALMAATVSGDLPKPCGHVFAALPSRS